MAYYFYIGKMLCPVAPSKLQMKINGNDKTLTLINEGEVSILKKAKLTEVSFDILLPNVQYPFAMYKSGFRDAKYFLEQLEQMKIKQKPFQFIVTRTLPNGKMLFDTNLKVALKDYQIKEDANEGFDVVVTINLRQFKVFGTKTCKIKKSGKKAIIEKKETRSAENSPAPTPSTTKTYTVKKGDCLWAIAKKFYGNGSKYNAIANANKGKIKSPNLIYAGQVLTIPSL